MSKQSFHSEFLNQLEAALDAAVDDPRRVKLGVEATFKREVGIDIDYEWTYYCFRKQRHFDLDIQGIDSGEMHVIVRSDRRKTMGKVLLKVEYLTIPINHQLIVDSIFSSIAILNCCICDSNEMKAVSQVREIWEGISFRVV